MERAPIAFLATADAQGNLDVSPKGDAPGFVVVEDPQTLLLPDRPGNHLAFGFLNILQQPTVSLIFVVPGAAETLRVSGTAEITRDPRCWSDWRRRGGPRPWSRASPWRRAFSTAARRSSARTCGSPRPGPNTPRQTSGLSLRPGSRVVQPWRIRSRRIWRRVTATGCIEPIVVGCTAGFGVPP
ncbi:MAG: hypothetical protein HC809_13185 [Gammaproteobacteria bacterium]|nr:hypothetical protein [Gammaproteobacteria bacterium]